MPDKPLTVLTYAASASLAAVALVYLFNPSYLLDAVPGAAPASDSRFRRGRAVGLSNPANDCFINSILQALAGLNALQGYLVDEIALRDADEEAEDGEGIIYGYREQQQQARRHAKENRNGDGEEGAREGRWPEKQEVNGNNGSASVDKSGAPGPDLEKDWKHQAKVRKDKSLLHAEVTRGLKVMLEQLNDRSSQRKVISAGPFVHVLESAFATRVNRNQQDAQELLQVVAERMAEEYAAGKQARERAEDEGLVARKRRRPATQSEEAIDEKVGDKDHTQSQQQEDGVVSGGQKLPLPITTVNGRAVGNDLDESAEEEEESFPLLGQTKHQVECQHCHFIPSSKPTDFIMLTLSVPPKSSATLDECLDQFSKQEFIDDYKCDKCRIHHAIETYEQELARAKSDGEKERLRTGLFKLKIAIDKDPENPPKDVQLPDSKLAPTRQIARSVKVTSFPKVLVIHLSRSSFDPASFSSKNTAKVVFPETLPLGSLVDRRKYRLLGLVTHKGTHHSGHYETFRRVHPTPVSMSDLTDDNDDEAASDIGSSARSPTPTPLSASRTVVSPEPPTSDGDVESDVETEAIDSVISGPTANATATGAAATASGGGRSSSVSRTASSVSRKPRRAQKRPSTHLSPPSSRPSSPPDASRSSLSTLPTPESVLQQQQQQQQKQQQGQRQQDGQTGVTGATERATSRQRMRDRFEEAKGRKREKRLRRVVARENQRWWRISDDKVRECRTSEVLGMQKEGYLLFYEMVA